VRVARESYRCFQLAQYTRVRRNYFPHLLFVRERWAETQLTRDPYKGSFRSSFCSKIVCRHITSRLTNFRICNVLKFIPIRITARIFQLTARNFYFGLTQKAQAPSDRSSGSLYGAESLTNSPTTRALVSDFDMLEISDFVKMLISLFLNP
jgi:hypothetical protein